jgi:cytochrome P450/NADPH-cytochrome P450 reductase
MQGVATETCAGGRGVVSLRYAAHCVEGLATAKLFAAFSREPGKPKAYVQQAIQDQSEDVWRLMQKEAMIFVCGEASHMAPEVRQAFLDVYREKSGVSQADAQVWLDNMVASHRYLEDIWASGA